MLDRQDEAKAYVERIDNAKHRVLMEYLLAHAIGFFVRDPVRRTALAEKPFDLLLYVTCAHDALRGDQLVDAIRSGSYSSFEDIPDLF